MNSRTSQSRLLWLAAICLFLQSAGTSAGKVLCLGCADESFGMALTSAPCISAGECCAGDSEETAGDEEEPSDCNCVDVALASDDGAPSWRSMKATLSFLHFGFPAADLAPPAQAVAAIGSSMRGARAAPPAVRLLAPSARRTVLIV
jgi:hypothetical protein